MDIKKVILQLVGLVIRLAVLVAVFGVAVTGGYTGYTRFTQNRPAAASTTYRFVAAQRTNLAATVATTGSLVPISQVKLSFKSGGKLKELNVKVGDVVKAGAVLARLDTTDLEFTLAQNMVSLENAQLKLAQLKAGPTSQDITIAKTNLDKSTLALQKAQSDYDKVAWRNDVGQTSQAQALQSATLDYQSALANYAKATAGSTTTDLQIQENQVKTAQIQVDQARSNIQGATIVAPFDGMIASVTGNVGEQVAATPMITLVDLSAMRVEANIDETDIGRVAVGQTVNITFDSLSGLTLPAKITTIAPNATAQSGVVTYQVHAVPTQTDPRLRAGMTATASIVVEQRTNVLAVANRAIKINRGVKTVEVAQPDGTLLEKQVTTGLANDTNTEILSGLSDGEMVAIATTVTNQPATGAAGLFGGSSGLRMGGTGTTPAAPGR